ncbi:VanZ family protein [Longirhabdus pacifica]|uniref:VanZ family protein n=1 Tax=Longirhabdus pacifica TaxID=2305227 RepID=UPI001008D47A
MRWKLRVAHSLPILICLSFIYFFSTQSYEQQNIRPLLNNMLLNLDVHHFFMDISFYYNHKEISVQNLGIDGFVEFFIRKAAHVLEFMCLGFFLFRWIHQWTKAYGVLFKLICFLMIILLFASIDELNQIFSTNRAPYFGDVIIDLFGSILGMVLYVWIRPKFYKSRRAEE